MPGQADIRYALLPQCAQSTEIRPESAGDDDAVDVSGGECGGDLGEGFWIV